MAPNDFNNLAGSVRLKRLVMCELHTWALHMQINTGHCLLAKNAHLQ